MRRYSLFSISILLVVAAGLGCASTLGSIAWPTPAPHPVTLKVVGNEVDKDKTAVCEQVVRDAGATLTDRAPIILTVTLDSKVNQYSVATSPERVLFNERSGASLLRPLCGDAIRKAAELYPRGTVQDFVAEKLLHDTAFKALIEGVEQAQAAFNMAAETPIDELDEDSDRYAELVKVINAAHDAYRKYDSYGRTNTPSSFETSDSGVLVDPSFDGKVKLPGTSAVLRVDARPDRITILAIESDRGRTMVSFNNDMKATVVSDFRPYLVGDKIDVGGAFKKKIKRGNTARAAAQDEQSGRPTPASNAVGGCTKDNDCKGSRICERGTCVSPR